MSNHEQDELTRRLEALGRSAPPRSPDFTRRVMDTVANEHPGSARPQRTLQLKRWIMRASIGVAACALIGAFTWTLLVSEPQRAYGIQDIRERLAGVNSIRIAGRAHDGSRIEIYAARPDRSYRVQRTLRTVTTGDKHMVLDDAAKTATLGPSSAFEARYVVEMVLQNLLVDQLLGPAKDRLTKVRAERVGDVEADVYESVLGDGPRAVRSEVFLDPRTGLPVKSVLHMRAGDKEVPVITFDEIQADAPAPAGVFDFRAPDGYALRQTDAQPANAEMVGAGGATGTRLRVRYALEVAGGRAMLLCWSLYGLSAPADDLKLPAPDTFTVTGPRSPYTHVPLRSDPSAEGFHWRWSLFVPTDPAVRVADNPISFQVKADGATLGCSTQALRFGPDELPRLILEAQQRTLPPGGKLLTLQQIEWQIGTPVAAP